MRRRRLLGAAALAVSLAGCGEARDGDARGPRRSDSPPATATATRGPYRAPGREPLSVPRGVRLHNVSDRDRYVTVVLTHDGEAAFLDSRTVRADERLRLAGLVGTAATLGVVVETADGLREEATWTVDPAFGDLSVTLDDGVAVRRRAVCGRACPLAVDGGGPGDVREGAGGPRDAGTGTAGGADGAPGPREGNDTDVVMVDGAGGSTRTVGLAVEGPSGTVVDGRFRLPGDARLVVPTGRRYAGYEVRVVDGGRTDRYRWHSAASRFLYVAVDRDRTRFRCSLARRDVVVRNDADRATSLSLSVRGDGRPLLSRTLDLAAGDRRVLAGALAPTGRYTFGVAARGRRQQYAWELCPPPGPVYVVVTASGVRVSITPLRRR